MEWFVKKVAPLKYLILIAVAKLAVIDPWRNQYFIDMLVVE